MAQNTLPAFNATEFKNAHIYLATQVAEMMGRKFEEGDWSKVYCTAKEIPLGKWSNLSIDVTYGCLGVEQKMICRRTNQSIMEACGTSIMHPAGTRSIRIPDKENATTAARIVLQQYVDIVEHRTALVRIANNYHHGQIDNDQAIAEFQALGMSKSSAFAALPSQRRPVGLPNAKPDMRIGWLLWQESLREFLYFEEQMKKPNPKDFVAEWHDSGGGRRKKSRNLWVYNKNTNEKFCSITTEAGAKIQPYFTIPTPNDPNLYHFVVQGEDCGNGTIRVWLTKITAGLLQEAIGDLKPAAIADAIERASIDFIRQESSSHPFGSLAVEIIVPLHAYEKLQRTFEGVSDEHNFKQLLEVLRERT